MVYYITGGLVEAFEVTEISRPTLDEHRQTSIQLRIGDIALTSLTHYLGDLST